MITFRPWPVLRPVDENTDRREKLNERMSVLRHRSCQLGSSSVPDDRNVTSRIYPHPFVNQEETSSSNLYAASMLFPYTSRKWSGYLACKAPIRSSNSGR
jgi:hypothetical protein